MTNNVNSRAMKKKNSEPDYKALYAHAMLRLNDSMRETLQLRKYIHALETDALNAYLNKSKYFQSATTKYC